MKELEELGDYEENKDVKENEKVSGSVITEGMGDLKSFNNKEN